MSKENTVELTKSWVFVGSDGPPNEGNAPNLTSTVQEVAESESHGDSDTDSISVISESGCSYKTDDEEYTPTEEPLSDPQTETVKNEPEITEEKPQVATNEPELAPAQEPQPVELPCEPKGREKLLYFVTSAACAVLLIGVSVIIQHYLQDDAPDVNNFEPDPKVIFSQLRNPNEAVVKEEPSTKFAFRKIKQIKIDHVDQIPNKIAKLKDDSLNDNEPRVENRKYEYKPQYKSPPVKCDNENCDKNTKNHDKNTRTDDTNDKIKPQDESEPDQKIYNQKVKELKIKEDYLREKEKFLIEREHALLKKEIKLNKGKQSTKNKHDKKSPYKKDKEYESSSEEESDEIHENVKSNENLNKQKAKIKKHKNGEDKKKFSTDKRSKYVNDDKKRNISGQWYINLHEARDNMRQKKYAYFKRNKAHWYFQWMVDRARLRTKK